MIIRIQYYHMSIVLCVHNSCHRCLLFCVFVCISFTLECYIKYFSRCCFHSSFIRACLRLLHIISMH